MRSITFPFKSGSFPHLCKNEGLEFRRQFHSSGKPYIWRRTNNKHLAILDDSAIIILLQSANLMTLWFPLNSFCLFGKEISFFCYDNFFFLTTTTTRVFQSMNFLAIFLVLFQLGKKRRENRENEILHDHNWISQNCMHMDHALCFRRGL